MINNLAPLAEVLARGVKETLVEEEVRDLLLVALNQVLRCLIQQ